LKARGGIEPPIKVLQTFALPLGDRASETVTDSSILPDRESAYGYFLEGHDAFNKNTKDEGAPRKPWSSVSCAAPVFYVTWI
jgi:hypothetical protein